MGHGSSRHQREGRLQRPRGRDGQRLKAEKDDVSLLCGEVVDEKMMPETLNRYLRRGVNADGVVPNGRSAVEGLETFVASDTLRTLTALSRA